MREPKWHLYNKNNEPLCWKNDEWESEKLIDFDTIEEAFKFWDYVNYYYPEAGRQIYGLKKTIHYYDGGYVSGVEAKRLMLEELNEHIKLLEKPL